MNRALLLLGTIMLHTTFLMAQARTAFYKPDAMKGEDVIFTSDSSSKNYASNPEIVYQSWTSSGRPYDVRSLIRFQDMDTIPATAIILHAELNLYGVSSSGNWGTSCFSGSPYPLPNEGYLQRVTAPWKEHTVTWATQPTATALNQAVIPVSTARWSWNHTIDVTNLVKDIRASKQNNGFMLKLQVESFYRAVFFASSDHNDATLWPELSIQYEVPLSSSLEEHKSKVSTVFPNPCKDVVYIAGIDAGCTMILYDLTGRQVLIQTSVTGINQLNIPNVPKGTYLLKVTNPEGSIEFMHLIRE